MIPYCNDDGYLPPGIHRATLEEVASRFGQESELRQVQMPSLRWLVDLAHRAGVQRIVVNGSFVTDKLEANDVDCVLLVGADFPRDPAAEAELLAGLRSSSCRANGASGQHEHHVTVTEQNGRVVVFGMSTSGANVEAFDADSSKEYVSVCNHLLSEGPIGWCGDAASYQSCSKRPAV